MGQRAEGDGPSARGSAVPHVEKREVNPSLRPLFTNRFGFSVLGCAQRFIHPARTRPPRSKFSSGPENMPCRKENYIFLEQSVTVDSKEVDALVTKIGEALQLHNNNNNGTAHHHHLHHGITASATAGAGGKQSSPGTPSRQQQSKSLPHPELRRPRLGQIRPWSKKRLAVEEDDPHTLLQELILSGNLIKEAVRRLQFSAGDCADNVSC
ncbi:hypothetical protein WMY93_000248 [Mugilogobius chulae]|uniref:GSK-3-binding protein n=1 Tax=Mugilogobius chulae TaxID=88201 RepID=A0AAW0Q1X4_9GOBI